MSNYIPKIKKCTKCKKDLPFDSFAKHKGGKFNLSSWCNNCFYTYKNEWRRKKYKENETYRKKMILESKTYYSKNKESRNESHKQWVEKNREKIKKYINEKYNNNIQVKLATDMRNKLNCAILRNQKNGSAIQDLGCTIEYFKKYLEKKFKNGMSWENRGKWHIDHIVSLSTLDLTNKDNYKTLAHYSNLQPLWAIENIRKGSK